MSDWDDDEAEREMEKARLVDGRRTKAVARAVAAPQLGNTPSICMACGVSCERLALDPIRGGRVVCTGRFGPGADGKTVRIDCYDKLDRELADHNGRAYLKTRDIIRATKERGCWLDEDKRYLVAEYGEHSANQTIVALEERFQRIKDGAKAGGGRKRSLEQA